MSHDFVLVDVFSKKPFGGNQLAVFPNATGLSATQMQSIAREFNFAETTFVLPPEQAGHTRRLRIFSPGSEMPFAGHPTVGTAAVLAHLGAVPSVDGQTDVVFGEQVGPVQVRVTNAGGRLYSQLRLEAELERPDWVPDRGGVARTLGLPDDAVSECWFGSVGLRFCFAHVHTPKQVDAAVLDKQAWAATLKGSWAELLFFFSGDLRNNGSMYARMFAPGIGVDEDPATGSACAALVGYLAHRDPHPDITVALSVLQGVKIGRRSEISAGAQMKQGRLQHVTVGGTVTVTGTGTMTV
jgi:trans-2,3-dihydro-3-hydroxyanthranilate isomerase